MSHWVSVARTVPKRGLQPVENQDAYAVSTLNKGHRRIGLSDGATNAHDSGRWAAMLARAWASGSPGDWTSRPRSALLARLGQAWRDAVEFDGDAPWYVRTRAERGAYATLLGLDATIAKSQAQCRMVAVGDSNAFLLRGGKLLRSWPARRHADFGRFPDLVGSNAPPLNAVWRHTEFAMQREDVLLLATDALAAHLLLLSEQRTSGWQSVLGAVRQSRDFEAWVGAARTGGMTDDDTTLVVFRRMPK